MKKFLLSFIIIFIFQTPCPAEKLKAIALNNFSTADNEAKISILIAENFYLTSKLLIPKGSIFSGYMTNVKHPKRLKQNAKFDMQVVYYMTPDKVKYKLNLPVCGKYAPITDIDEEALAHSGVMFAVGKFIPGASFIYNGIKGMKQRKGGRIKGAVSNIYKHSILSQKEKGSEVHIKRLDCFYVSFPNYKEDEYREDLLFSQIDNYGNVLYKKNLPKSEIEDLELNYPYRHQYGEKIYYLARPKEPKQKK